MNKKEYINLKIKEYSSLKIDDQVKFLVFFGNDLTVLARDTYVVQSEEVENPKRLRAINEIQHTIYGHIWCLLNLKNERYPDDVLINIIFETNDEELAFQLSDSFERSINFITKN